MPHHRKPSGLRRAARWGILLSLAASLAACAPQGDFGRPRENALNDEAMPWLGNHLARLREEPVSGYSFTDAEREMRQLGYGLMMPTHPADRANQFWAELRRTRIGDANRFDPDPRGYCRTLAREDYRSSKARFIRMTDDIRADRSRIEPFCTKAVEVAEADRVRTGAMNRIATITAVERRSGEDRITENRTIVRWVRHGLEQHVQAYRCALNNLIVATPEQEAVMAERELAALEADILRFDQICAGAGLVRGGPVAVEQAPRGFYPATPRPPPEEPIIIK